MVHGIGEPYLLELLECNGSNSGLVGVFLLANLATSRRGRNCSQGIYPLFGVRKISPRPLPIFIEQSRILGSLIGLIHDEDRF